MPPPVVTASMTQVGSFDTHMPLEKTIQSFPSPGQGATSMRVAGRSGSSKGIHAITARLSDYRLFDMGHPSAAVLTPRYLSDRSQFH